MEKEELLLDVGIKVLSRLRKAFQGDEETQEHINAVLDKLYNLKW